MIEKQEINGREVWLKVTSHPMDRENPNVIPREYFSARYYFSQPEETAGDGEPIRDEDGSDKLFESPVAALTYAWKQLKQSV